LSRVSLAVREFGLTTAVLYLAGRALARLGGDAALHDLLLYVQRAPARPMLPTHRGTSIEIRVMDGAAALAAGVPCPPDLRDGRRRPDVYCLAAYVQGQQIGHHWLNLCGHDDEMVRCRYEPWPARRAAWSFDLLIAPAYRGGLAYARLMDASWDFLRRHGRDRLASYIAATNRGAIAAEARSGGRHLGRAVHLRLGCLQLMASNLPPYLHLSFSDRGRPVQRLGLDDGETA